MFLGNMDLVEPSHLIAMKSYLLYQCENRTHAVDVMGR